MVDFPVMCHMCFLTERLKADITLESDALVDAEFVPGDTTGA